MNKHEIVYGICKNKCKVEVFSKEQAKDLLEEQIVVMEEDSYIKPSKRKKGVLYFNATEKVSSGSSESCESIKVSKVVS